MKFELRLYFFLITMLVPTFFGARAVAETSFPKVIVETSMGSFTLELYPDKAPKTVANFLAYVDEGFYNNTLFHRVEPNFVVQGGGFDKGMKAKKTRESVKNESANRLKNLRGTISMARRMHPDTATSQFYLNLADNAHLDYKSKVQPGYTVFGRVSQGMDVIDKISKLSTHKVDKYSNVPEKDVFIVSTRYIPGKPPPAAEKRTFTAGEDYVVLERPVSTRDKSKVEVVEMFSYGCPHCYEFESLVKGWAQQQDGDVDFSVIPAIWNKPMVLYARAFYTIEALNVAKEIHIPLFTAIVVDQKVINTESDLEAFFVARGVDKKAFSRVFKSQEIKTKVTHAAERVRLYKPAGVPEIIVNGKYRVERMRAGGLKEMLTVVDFLVEKERATLKKKN
ncbi:Peptidyl-prolyl cis-trans isomerase PpiA precursor [hydrothermal vent metagenome]|uniref:Peptidyl-prolyl cis-trans isomerase PpiA n=1 Tax=hydrothermal vent metagenome TaxID=652676 RepID=A0A3B0ZL12_9ZZZZ